MDLCQGVFLFLVQFFLIFWPYCAACGISVPWPEIKPKSPALAAWSLNRWTTTKVPTSGVLWGSSEMTHPKHLMQRIGSTPPMLATLVRMTQLCPWARTLLSQDFYFYPISMALSGSEVQWLQPHSSGLLGWWSPSFANKEKNEKEVSAEQESTLITALVTSPFFLSCRTGGQLIVSRGRRICAVSMQAPSGSHPVRVLAGNAFLPFPSLRAPRAGKQLPWWPVRSGRANVSVPPELCPAFPPDSGPQAGSLRRSLKAGHRNSLLEVPLR